MQGLELVFRIGLFYVFIICGYLVTHISGKGQVINKVVTALLINILLPILVIYSLLETTPQIWEEVPVIVALAIIIQLSGPVLLFVYLWRVNIEKSKKGTLLLCAVFNNALFLPIPIVLTFVGEVGLSTVIIFSLTQMILLVFLGTPLSIMYSESNPNAKEIARTALKFPPLLAALMALILLSMSFTLPPTIANLFSYSGDLTTYLALFSVGLSFGSSFSLTEVRIGFPVIIIRQFLIPLATAIALPLIGLSSITGKVLLLEAMMPPAVLNVVFATSFDLDPKIAATIVTLGTLLFLPIVPFLPLFLLK